MAKTPHARLKALRKLMGITQAQLAEKIGVKYTYLLAIEVGQRQLTERVARLIAAASGVAPQWLEGKLAAKYTVPCNIFGEALTKEDALRCFSPNEFERLQIDNHGDEVNRIVDLTETLSDLLRAAYRKGKFYVAVQRLRDEMALSISELDLKAAIRSESRDEVPGWIINQQDAEFPELEDIDDYDMFNAWRLITPAYRARWAEDLKAGTTDFADELDAAAILVRASYTAIRKPKSPKAGK